ncbi:hypothetical protein O0544_14930 [Edwardsiella anguillarum]|nr:hypothetical protein [Edwardsiella anguillarum]
MTLSSPAGRLAYRLPPTAYRLPPTAYRLPPTAYRLPPTAYRLLPTAYCLPRADSIAHQAAQHSRIGVSLSALLARIKSDGGRAVKQNTPIVTSFVGIGNAQEPGWKGYAGIRWLDASLDIDRAYDNGVERRGSRGSARSQALNTAIPSRRCPTIA